MALLEITQVRQITASIRLDQKVAEQVDQYASFIHATADDVVNHALDYVFGKDRDFQEFLKAPQASQTASTLRIRKGPSKVANDTPQSPARKLAAGAESMASVRGMKA